MNEIKLMPFKIMFGDNEVEAFIKENDFEKVVKIVEQNKNKNKTGYERVYDSDYYINDVYGRTEKMLDGEWDYGDEHYDAANYYSDKTVAENNARADKLMRQLRRFAAFQRDKNLDWNNIDQYKYYIEYNYYSGELCTGSVTCMRDAFDIYFHSESCANAAIDLLHDELIWYFTEYKDSL